MKAALATALRESCGYLEDQGWHQTAQLMVLAADEIDLLNARLRELETAHETQPAEDLLMPDASNQNVVRRAAVARR